jgi:hypothetical protein
MTRQIPIAAAERVAKIHDCQAVVIIAVERDGTVRRVTYGETRFKCRVIGEWAAALETYAMAKSPFQTAFGWGNGGKPKALSAEELAQLSEAGRAWALRSTAIGAEQP